MGSLSWSTLETEVVAEALKNNEELDRIAKNAAKKYTKTSDVNRVIWLTLKKKWPKVEQPYQKLIELSWARVNWDEISWEYMGTRQKGTRYP